MLRVIFFIVVLLHQEALHRVINHGGPVVEAEGWRKKPQPLKFVGGARYMKDLQKTVFFAAYDMAVFSLACSMTEKEQKEIL